MSAHTLREEVARIIDPKAYEDFPVGGTEPHHDWLDRERALAIADQILELPDLALFDRPSVPDGWRLVPEEPTRTMLDAGWEAGVEWGDTKANGKHARRKWAAMLAGAPDFFAENAKNPPSPSPPVGQERGGWRPSPLADEHELKCHDPFFQDVIDGRKPFEVRKHDRCYRPGDILWLREWRPNTERYSGRDCRVGVTYLLQGGQFGIEPGYCVLGVTKPLPPPPEGEAP